MIPCSKSNFYLKCNWIVTISLRVSDLVTLFSNLSLHVGAFTVFATPYQKKRNKNFSWAPFVLTNGCYIGPYNLVYDFILWWNDGLFCLNFVMLTYLEGEKLLITIDIGRGSKIGHELDTTRHDMKLAGYALRLNGFLSYSGWQDWSI